MRRLLFIALFCSSFFVSSEETISRWMSDYFERIHGHIGDENYEKAKYELEMGNNNYFRGGRTYEAALLYQLYGQFYACLLYTSPSPRDRQKSRMPSSA